MVGLCKENTEPTGPQSHKIPECVLYNMFSSCLLSGPRLYISISIVWNSQFSFALLEKSGKCLIPLATSLCSFVTKVLFAEHESQRSRRTDNSTEPRIALDIKSFFLHFLTLWGVAIILKQGFYPVGLYHSLKTREKKIVKFSREAESRAELEFSFFPEF